ncbi:unnamed protein product [Caenorhabditis auriculariae]|uniref:Cadherin domain-containing protein n=1 Tax=Caenorhabditis auriculariae TaxID=2777116 RepID=A0A8S1H623_9PELO|nr:unnamed protein product [Caenorhabditis auriculariae]
MSSLREITLFAGSAYRIASHAYFEAPPALQGRSVFFLFICQENETLRQNRHLTKFLEVMLLLFFAVIPFLAANVQAHETVILPANVPVGWLVSDLRLNRVLSQNESAELQPSPFSHLFVIRHGAMVLTNGKLQGLDGELVELTFTAKQENFQRIIALNVYIGTSNKVSTSFLRSTYTATAYSSAEIGSKIIFSEPIALRNFDPALKSPATIQTISDLSTTPFSVVPNGKLSVDIILTRSLEDLTERKEYVLYLGARNLFGETVAQCKVSITVEILGEKSVNEALSSDIFGPIPANVTVFNVAERLPGPALFFKLGETSKFFTINKLTGEVSTRHNVGFGTYLLQIVVGNRKKAASRIPLELHVIKEMPKPLKKVRPRRHLDDVVFNVKENELVVPKMRIALYPGEKIGEVSAAREKIRIDQDGNINLLEPLNYEKTSTIIATVPVTGMVHSTLEDSDNLFLGWTSAKQVAIEKVRDFSSGHLRLLTRN